MTMALIALDLVPRLTDRTPRPSKCREKKEISPGGSLSDIPKVDKNSRGHFSPISR